MSSKELDQAKAKWESQLSAPRAGCFTTLSDMEVPLLSTPADLEESGFDYMRDLGFPGEYPYTRGVQRNMYRGKLWTMRQFAGFASAEETNTRFKMLLANGQTGLSTAFDMPTLMGYDADSPRSIGEVGRCGVAVSSLEDMERLYDEIPLGEVTTSMTVNGPAIVLLAMYYAVAEKQGVPKDKVRGTIQNDILKEYIAQKEWLFPVKPAVELVIDTIEWGAKYYPGWNTVSISGYHIREAGATAVQELAFTLADGLAYVDACLARGMKVDDFAPRLSFFFDVHNDFFEEVAKFRAARRLWSKLMRERYQARDPRSWMLRTHAQTAGVSLTAQQPYNNIVRVSLQALAAIMGGTQSLHTNSMDETLSLPTDESVMIALRTQQIIAEESGVANVVDPFGGSYFMETLTTKIEKDAMAYIKKIDELGGMVKAIERGYPQAEIANSAYHFQRQLEAKEKVMVGVNKYWAPEPKRINTLTIDRSVEKRQIERLVALKKNRNPEACARALKNVEEAATNGTNLVGPITEAVKSYATLQEVCDTLRGVLGIYRETGSF
ncbi:MAG TPA: methylmalonyl-CoA mutase [Bdellovibrionales bacterium]|nr:MAG: methylmalonyl-CoA mutase [Bdellovibrionales bacterium GWB1_52_6]OFZ04424.1 MAG: methylmalonyl-CoA mutase [Bdellovibrionales bacterium GWA1_52_35]OFZ38024.1 MAG: methylmalonyl-CoA mutase [Bdellovibrionales bacterium GWC1_52_8]HAR43069.1 methylmalonyl-CoA mutase [Bdellovibrionales bacterium]HCM40717.1 methylmalonyl-CoA mutase [Bdellovibrionales bacterium]